MAGRRETNDLKPIDRVVERTICESPGRSASERTGGLENTQLRRPNPHSMDEGNIEWPKLANMTLDSGGVVAAAR